MNLALDILKSEELSCWFSGESYTEPVKALEHFKALGMALQPSGAKAELAFDTFQVEVKKGSATYRFFPIFVESETGKRMIPAERHVQRSLLVGWLPFEREPVDVFADKLTVKKYLVSRRLPTPKFSTEKGAGLTDVLVKQNRSSAARQVLGPYRRATARELDSSTGEFFERFIPGQILRVHFWDAVPVVLEREQMPAVTGDGRRTIEALVEQRVREKHLDEPIDFLPGFLSYFGKSMESVLSPGEVQIIDFRRGSPLAAWGAMTRTILARETANILTGELARVGKALWRWTVGREQAHIAYTVDAILDEQRKLWILGADPVQSVHPELYGPMVDSILVDGGS